MRGLDANPVPMPGQPHIGVAAVIGMRPGKHPRRALLQLADQRRAQEVIGSRRAPLFEAGVNGQPLRQQHLGHDAMRVPGVPAAREPFLYLRVLCGRRHCGRRRCGLRPRRHASRHKTNQQGRTPSQPPPCNRAHRTPSDRDCLYSLAKPHGSPHILPTAFSQRSPGSFPLKGKGRVSWPRPKIARSPRHCGDVRAPGVGWALPGWVSLRLACGCAGRGWAAPASGRARFVSSGNRSQPPVDPWGASGAGFPARFTSDRVLREGSRRRVRSRSGKYRHGPGEITDSIPGARDGPVCVSGGNPRAGLSVAACRSGAIAFRRQG